MNEDYEPKQNSAVPGLLTEDTSVVSGVDKATGAPVTRPKRIDGRCDESMVPTDARESQRETAKD